MKKNVGGADRVIRIIAAAVLVTLVALHFLVSLWSITLAWVLAAVFVFTAFAGICPLYSLFGLSTCQRKKEIP